MAIATTETTFQDSGLAANTTYSYSVTAIDWANNESAPSEPAFATTCPTPAGRDAAECADRAVGEAVSATSIGLPWTGSTDPGAGASVSDTFDRGNGGLGGAWTAAERDVPDRESACGAGDAGDVYGGAADDAGWAAGTSGRKWR